MTSLTTFELIAAHLRACGLPATVEYPGYVDVTKTEYCYAIGAEGDRWLLSVTTADGRNVASVDPCIATTAPPSDVAQVFDLLISLHETGHFASA